MLLWKNWYNEKNTQKANESYINKGIDEKKSYAKDGLPIRTDEKCNQLVHEYKIICLRLLWIRPNGISEG